MGATDETKTLIRHQGSSLLLAHRPRDVLSKVERDELKELRAGSAFIIVPADKGRSTVVLDRTDYNQKAKRMLEDRHSYVPCEFNPIKTLTREMHIVAYSSMYTRSSTAPSAPGGLAVIGVFFQLTTDQSNSSLSKMGDLLSLISRLRTSGSETEMQPLDPRVVLPKSRDRFFRYYGSLTTPPCTENVQWTVMRDPLYVTTAEEEAFFGSPIYDLILDAQPAEDLDRTPNDN
nr:unnamed protein product [Spirometra erinaceieuropaei]